MRILNWLFGKRKTTAIPEIIEPLGPRSPVVAYHTDTGLMMTDRESFEHQFFDRQLPNPAQQDVVELVARADRICVYAGGLYRSEAMNSSVLADVTGPDAIAALRQALAIIENPGQRSRCACLGGPTLQIYSSSDKIGAIGLQHGTAIRHSGWTCDAPLVDGSALDNWLADNGVDADLLKILYKNPFPLTGGVNETSSSDVLSPTEQRLLLAEALLHKLGATAALEECGKVLQSAESDPGNAYELIARIHKGEGDAEKAIAACSDGIEQSDAPANLHYQRALLFGENGDLERAICDCTSALEFDPVHFNSLNSRALFLWQVGREEDALLDFRLAMQLKPNWPLPYINRAQLNGSRGDLKMAIDDYTIAIDGILESASITEWPKLGPLYWNRGKTHEAMGNTNEAQQDLRIAVERSPRLESQL